MALLSRRSIRAKELGLEGQTLAPEELLDLLAKEPRLLKRPILTDGHHVVVGYDQKGLQAAFGS